MDWIFPTLQEFSFASYWLLGLAALLEATPVVGTFVPGTVFVLGAGSAAAGGYFSLPTLAWIVFIGALLGDLASYAIGRSSHAFLFRESLSGEGSPLGRAENFFHTYGRLSIFLSHFFGPVRAFVPLTAGLARMPLTPFVLFAALGASVWSLGLLAIGYGVGTIIVTPSTFLARYGLKITFVIIMLALIAISASRMIRIARYVPSAFRSSLLWLSQTRIARTSRIMLPALIWCMRRFHVHQLRGLPLTVLVLIALGLIFSATGLMATAIALPMVERFDTDITTLIRFADSSFSITVALIFTTLGESGSVIFLSALTLLALLMTKKRIHALGLFFVLASTESTVLLTKYLVERPRPILSLLTTPLSTYAFPSAHAAIAVALYGYIALLFIRTRVSVSQKTTILSLAFILILGIGGSRILLGVHYPSDVIVGYIIGALWLAFTLSVELYIASKASLTQATSQPHRTQ